jgi:hypothetical protein
MFGPIFSSNGVGALANQLPAPSNSAQTELKEKRKMQEEWSYVDQEGTKAVKVARYNARRSLCTHDEEHGMFWCGHWWQALH